MLCKSRKCTNMRKASHWDVTNQVTEISLDLTDVDIFSQLSDIGLLFHTDSVFENCHISRCLQVASTISLFNMPCSNCDLASWLSVC